MTKYLETAALSLVAVSCAWKVGEKLYCFPGTPEPYIQEGTGVIIDGHHILSSARVFEFPEELSPPPPNLAYLYVFVCVYANGPAFMSVMTTIVA
jgi:hypothetical protein